jgi:hypothetical protein
MERGTSRDFRYLDTEIERKDLVADIRQVRRAVVRLAEALPPTVHDQPRYHGWTPNAMLAHLHLMDNLELLAIQMALLGLHPPLSSGVLDGFNALTARLFQKRVMAATLKGIARNEQRITDFILRLPIDRFSRPVYYPPQNTYLTVERALQAFFLFHWQEHLATMHKVEGMYL